MTEKGAPAMSQEHAPIRRRGWPGAILWSILSACFDDVTYKRNRRAKDNYGTYNLRTGYVLP